jgi:hypothetical protein
MKTESDNRIKASTEVQTYNKMMSTFQKVASRKDLEERRYKNGSRRQTEGSKLKSLLEFKSRTTWRALRRTSSLLSNRNNCNNNLVRST